MKRTEIQLTFRTSTTVALLVVFLAGCDASNKSGPAVTPAKLEKAQSASILDSENQPTSRAQIADKPASEPAPSGDLATRAQKLINQPFSAGRNVMLVKILDQMRRTDPAEAFRLAQLADTPESKQAVVKELARLWAKEDYAATYAFGSSLPQEPVGRRLQVAAMKVWAQVDPVGAIRAMVPLTKAQGGDLIYFPTIELGKTNPNLAFELIGDIQDREVWATGAGQIFNSLAARDPKAAETMFLEQRDPEVKIAFGYALGSQAARRSLPDGLRILNQIGDYGTADHFLHGMLHYLAEGEQNSVTFLPLVEQISDAKVRESAADSTARGVVRWAPEKAIDWAETLPVEKTRWRAYQGIGWGYAGKDLEAAQTWLGSLAPGMDRNYAIFGFADATRGTNPALAAEWLVDTPDVEDFGVIMRSSLTNWSAKDPGSAHAWAIQHGVENYLPPAR